MQEIIDFLLSFEQTAGELYARSSLYFKNNKALAVFLKALSEDEAWHYSILKNVRDSMNDSTLHPKEEIILEPRRKESISGLFMQTLEKLSQQQLTEKELLFTLIEVEYSEWNSIFLYIIHALVKTNRQFRYAAKKFQDHLHRVEKYILTLEDNQPYLDKLQGIGRIWDYRIIIADDNEGIRNLLQRFFSKRYTVDTAADGRSALKLIKKRYYDMVITDIDMPVLNGIELYQKLLQLKIDISKKAIFISGQEDYLPYLIEHKLLFLKKPFGLDEIRQLADNIIPDHNSPETEPDNRY